MLKKQEEREHSVCDGVLGSFPERLFGAQSLRMTQGDGMNG